MIPTNEERLELEVAEKRQYIEEYANEKAELRQRLAQIAAVITAPLIDEELDVAAFGRGAWVYCRQHCKPHQTGWCGVSPRDKVGLGVDNATDAIDKCRAWGLELYTDRKD